MRRTDIVNATVPVVIEVPEQLTHSHRQRNPYHCVFAEACASLPRVEEAIVHLSTAYLRFRGEKEFRRYRVQTRLRDQIVMFDRFRQFDPGVYTLGVIQPSHRARGERQGTAGNGGSNGRKRPRPAPLEGVRERAKIGSL